MAAATTHVGVTDLILKSAGSICSRVCSATCTGVLSLADVRTLAHVV